MSTAGVSPAKIGKFGDFSRMAFRHSQVEAIAQITSYPYSKTRTAGPAISKLKRGKSINSSSSEKSFGRSSLPLLRVMSMCRNEAQWATKKHEIDGRQSYKGSVARNPK